MLHEPATRQMRIILAMVLTLLAKIMEDLSDFGLFQVLEDFGFGLVLYRLAMLADQGLALCAETLLDAVPVYDRAV